MILNDKKIKSSRNFILERNYEDAVEEYLYIIEKNVNGIMEFQKMNFLAYFLFLVTIIVLPQMAEVACLICFINNEKKFF